MEHVLSFLMSLFVNSPRLGLLVVAGVVGAIAALLALATIRVHVLRFIDLNRRGWTIDRLGSGGVGYVERVNGRLETMTFRREGTPPDVPYRLFVPGEDAWDRVSPAWSRGRRKEIVGRVRSRLSAEEFMIVDETHRSA